MATDMSDTPVSDKPVRCPFYGASLVFADELLPRGSNFTISPHLMVQSGNRCALITSAHSPCAMEILGYAPRWATCSRNPEVNGIYRPFDGRAMRRSYSPHE